MPNENPDDSQNVQQQELDQKIGNIVNSAVTAHLKRFTEKALPDLLASAIKPFTDKIAAAPVTPPEGDDTKKSKSKQMDPEVAAMAQKLEQLTKDLADRDNAIKAEQKKNREERAYQDLRGSLEGKVRPELLDLVAKNLFQVEGLVQVEEDGTALFKTKRAPYVGADPEETLLPLRAGIEDFLKSESAKAFLPAPSPGAGANPLPKRGPSAPPGGTDFSKPATTDAEKARRALEREQRALQNTGGNR